MDKEDKQNPGTPGIYLIKTITSNGPKFMFEGYWDGEEWCDPLDHDYVIFGVADWCEVSTCGDEGKAESGARSAIRETAEGLHETGVIDEQSLREFEQPTPVAPGDHRSDLIQRLKSKEYAAEYLMAALEEGEAAYERAVADVAEALGWPTGGRKHG